MLKFLIICLLICPFQDQIRANTYTDSRGRTVKLINPPKRIASTSLAGDEILIELLSRQGQLPRLIAISSLSEDSNYSNITSEAKTIKGRAGNELENLLAQKPDLIVLASYNRPAMITRLDKANVPAFVLGGFNSFDDITNSIQKIGKLIGATKEAESLVGELSKTRKTLAATSRVHKKKVTILNFSETQTLNGKNTTFDSIVTGAGATNLASEMNISGWSKIGVEKLITLNPDYVIAIGDPQNADKIKEKIKKTLGYRSMKAVKENRIILVPGRILLSVSHHAIKASQIIHKALWSK